MARPKSTNYINNAELYKHLSAYIYKYREAKRQEKTLPQVPKYVGEVILAIAKNLATKSNFGGYSFREEMIGDGIENCLRYLHNFDPDKSNNPFGYLTLIMWRAFVRRIERESEQNYTRHKMILNNADLYDSIQSEMTATMLDSVSLDKSSQIVQNFEDKQQRKKDKKALKAEQSEE